MTAYRRLQLITFLLPTLLIGGFEYIRHEWLLNLMSMEVGNVYITLLTLIISFLYASWMFRTLRTIQTRLSEEEAKRAVYEERERLARELHDGIAQTLFYLNVRLKQGKIEDARSVVSTIDHQVRQAIFNLRTLPDESLTLCKRLSQWLQEWSILTGIEVEQHLDLPADRFEKADEVHLFGIVQEAFANIRKHADAHHVVFRLTADPAGGWLLQVADDGRGFDPEATGMHYGLTMLRERAEQLGAQLQITSSPQNGTTLTLIARGGYTR